MLVARSMEERRHVAVGLLSLLTSESDVDVDGDSRLHIADRKRRAPGGSAARSPLSAVQA